MLASSVHFSPLEFSKQIVLFLWYLCVILLWKYRVLLSPSCWEARVRLQGRRTCTHLVSTRWFVSSFFFFFYCCRFTSIRAETSWNPPKSAKAGQETGQNSPNSVWFYPNKKEEEEWSATKRFVRKKKSGEEERSTTKWFVRKNK